MTSNAHPLIIPLQGYESFATALGEQLENKTDATRASPFPLQRKHFPDGETYLRFSESVSGRHVVVVGSTQSECDLVEMLAIAWQAVRDGASTLSFAIPYFGYSTMERAVMDGEIVRAKTNAVLFSTIPHPPGGKHIYLLDLHSEGIPHYFEGGANVVHLYAKGPLLAIIKNLIGTSNVVVGSADTGRAKWVESYAHDLGAEVAIITKRRLDDRHTKVLTIGGTDVRGRIVLLYDDMIRSGTSIINAIRAYQDAGAARLIVAATHLVLQTIEGWKVLDRILDAGVSDLVVTDSLAHVIGQIKSIPDRSKQARIHVATTTGLFSQAIQTHRRVEWNTP